MPLYQHGTLCIGIIVLSHAVPYFLPLLGAALAFVISANSVFECRASSANDVEVE